MMKGKRNASSVGMAVVPVASLLSPQDEAICLKSRNDLPGG